MPTFRRNTRQRQVILTELMGCRDHPSAADLYDMVRRKLPRISLGTIYRNLDLLASRGRIRKLVMPDGQARFDGNASQHYHLLCAGCGQLTDVDGFPGQACLADIEHLDGYEIVSHRLDFIGRCPACQQRTGVGDRGAAAEA